MYYQTVTTFSEWLMSELDKRGWSRSEAARRGKISASMFDKVINGYAQPGMRFIEGIARAFGMSPSEILEIAKTNKKETPISERIRNVVINLSEEDQTDIMVVTPFYYPRASRG